MAKELKLEEVDVLEELCNDLIKVWKEKDIDRFSKFYTSLIGLIDTNEDMLPENLHPVEYLDSFTVYHDRIPVERVVQYALDIKKWIQSQKDTRFR